MLLSRRIRRSAGLAILAERINYFGRVFEWSLRNRLPLGGEYPPLGKESVMATSRKKRQRKVEQKRAKRKAKRQAFLKRKTGGFVERLARAADAPLVHCVSGGDFEGEGMGSILISRRLSPGEIAFAMFRSTVTAWASKTPSPESHRPPNTRSASTTGSPGMARKWILRRPGN